MSLRDTLSTYWVRVQGELLPWLDDVMDGPLGAQHKLLVSILGLLRIEAFLPSWRGLIGRRPAERAALARAFVAKANSFFFVSTEITLRIGGITAAALPAAVGRKPRPEGQGRAGCEDQPAS